MNCRKLVTQRRTVAARREQRDTDIEASDRKADKGIQHPPTSARKRPSIIAVALALSALGMASSPGGTPPRSQPDLLAATQFERVRPHTAEQQAAMAMSLGELPAQAPAPETPPTTLAPVPEAPIAEAHLPVDQAIQAPPAFPARARRSSASARPPRPITVPPGPKEGGVWAVIVGVDDYPGESADLKAAVADARDVDAALAHYGVPASRRMVLLDGQATAVNIRRSLAWLASHAAADSTAVFFYSGHVRQVGGNPDGDPEVVDEALVAYDGVNVYDGEVAQILHQLEARTAWIGVAGCYGSGFDDVLAPGRLLTAAAAERDLAYENSALGHSYLVEYMVRRAMLQGHAPGSVQEAFNWARDEIARDYPNRQPVMVDRSRGPLILGTKQPVAPATPSQPQQPAPAPAQPQPAQPQPAQPQPAQPDNATPPPEDGGCTEVLGVSLCSQSSDQGWMIEVGTLPERRVPSSARRGAARRPG